eukprot:TRINITY_DN11114_c0_g1_i2.p1 TRINITY_DN11114_c0_g1~~TRINITY_DN11114_c0_g1_i2.p1  ORF type:complete len:486 (-),score=154.98 TRINITY_DN11114_c0_g1_i2:337-1794(-)
MSSEVSLIDVKAQVMTYDESVKKWTPSGSGEPSISKVQLFVHQQNKTHRIVARKIVDKEVVINCALVKGMRYNRATETFHQWRDTRQVYGLNFANVSDAVSFGDSVQEALEGDNKRNSQTIPVNGELERQQLERDRQRLVDEQREQERLARMREADEEAERRRVADEKLRKDKEEKARLEQEKREQDELQRKLNLQRMKEEEDERAQLAEQEKLLQEQVALKQKELDSIRAMEKKVQEDMESKVKSSPTPRGTGRRVELQEEIAEPVVGNAFGVQLKAPNPVKTESPVHTKSSVHTYDEQTLDDTEPIEPERPPSPVYNYPSPPPDMPASFHTGGAGGNKHKAVTQTSTASSAQPKKADSQRGGQNNNLMDEIQKRFESMRQRSGAKEEGNSPAPTSPYPGNRNVSPNPIQVKANQSFNANEKKDNFIKQDTSFKNKQVSVKSETPPTSKELQALKTEIMKEIKIELERTKQEILTEIRKELSKR